MYNQYSFESKLLKKYKTKIKDSLDDGFDYPIDKKTIRELMSYEMLMELVLSFLKERKAANTSQNMRGPDHESYNNSINRTSAAGSEDLLSEIENIQND